MTHIADGEIVEIVMDVTHVSRPEAGGEFERVIVQGVYPPGVPHPPPAAGAFRNVVQVFFGRNMAVSAFLIETRLPDDTK